MARMRWRQCQVQGQEGQLCGLCLVNSEVASQSGCAEPAAVSCGRTALPKGEARATQLPSPEEALSFRAGVGGSGQPRVGMARPSSEPNKL